MQGSFFFNVYSSEVKFSSQVVTTFAIETNFEVALQVIFNRNLERILFFEKSGVQKSDGSRARIRALY